jgi:very-short-patch-repair endonuclease
MRKDTLRIRGTTPGVEQAARRLRQAPTRAEVHLWQALRRRQLAGLKFRHQHPVGRFIADFYCPSLKLIIEIDGPIHDTQQPYDDARTTQLNAFGYHVLRFSNEDVLTNLPSVLVKIKRYVETNFPPESGG